MAQLHINIPKSIKVDAQAELKKHGQTLMTKIRSVLYSLARLNRILDDISSVPKENKPLSQGAKQDLADDSMVSTKKGTHE